MSSQPTPVVRTLPAVLALSLFAAVLFVGATPVASQQAHATLRGFEITGEYQLLIEGRVVEDAELRLSQTAAALLITAGDLEAPLLVWARSSRVDQIRAADMLPGKAGAVDLADGLEREYLGDFTPADKEFVLPIAERDVRMRAKPPLLGDRSLAELLEHSPGYRNGMNSYTPSADAIAQLGSLDGIEIEVYFGSWCGVCKNYLPFFLEVHEALSATSVSVRYFGLDYPPEGWQAPEVTQREVKGLPTAIVLRNGKEVGRFSGGKAFAKPEQALLDALK